MRIGQGYDVHRLIEGRNLILGGVQIPYIKGLDGQSDADVLTHAVMDAILGAAALGDIGQMFPDTDVKYKDAYSIDLLREVIKRVCEHGYRVSNIDCTVVAQAPRLAQYIPKMCERLAEAMGIAVTQVNVKATTEEKLGFTGSGEGMAVHAVVLLAD